MDEAVCRLGNAFGAGWAYFPCVVGWHVWTRWTW